jgi:hypothetical protein
MRNKKKEKTAVVNDNEKVLVANENTKEQEYELLDRELNMELKKVHLQERILSLQEKQQQIEQLDNRRLQIDERKTTIGMAEVIIAAIRVHIIDDERTVMGSEPFQIPVFDEIERGIMKKKFLQLMNQF